MVYGLSVINGLNELSRDTTVPELVITSDDIVQGSYSRSYISAKDRQPVCLIMVYRDQPEQSVGQTVTVEVRYPGTALSGPFEQHDLTEHCCRQNRLFTLRATSWPSVVIQLTRFRLF